MMVAAASSIDAAIEPQASQGFHVKDEVGTLTTSMCFPPFLFHISLSDP